MTIIQPHANDYKANVLVSVLMMACVIVALWGIFLYNQLVDLRHEVSDTQDGIRGAEVASAELKNSFYGVTNTDNLKSAAGGQSLVLDQNPQYVKLSETKQISAN